MKRYLPIALVVIVVIMGGAFLLAKPDKKDAAGPGDTVSTVNENKSYSPPRACEIFTLDDAKKVLGDKAQKSDVNMPDASNEDIAVTQCFYEQPPGNTMESIKAQKQASVLVRGAKNEKGTQSNEAVFKGSLKPPEAQDVSGYGDGAFWNPQFGQLNIYKNGNWYILSAGSSTPSEKTLDEAKRLADVIIDKL